MPLAALRSRVKEFKAAWPLKMGPLREPTFYAAENPEREQISSLREI
jgi:hypothetical protein